MKRIFLPSDSLRADIHLIGYPPMGESQVFILKDIVTETVYYSAVIDCYTYESINKTIDILNEYGLKKIDLLCWTHPDDDHSIGINDLVELFCTPDTKILLPEGIYGSPQDLVKYTPEILEFFQSIKTNNQNKNYNVNSATVITGQTQGVEKIIFTESLREIKFHIKVLAPCSAIIRRRMENGLSKKNDISIALIIELGELSFFLTGDIENQTINLLPAEQLANLTYLKTPHHTSKSSNSLLSIFSGFKGGYKIPYTCSTAYRKHDLPNEELIDDYRFYTDSFFTTHDDGSSEVYGIIKVEFNPFDNSAEDTLYGCARKLY